MTTSRSKPALSLIALLVAVASVSLVHCDGQDHAGSVTKTAALTLPSGWADTTPSLVRFSNLSIPSGWENEAVAIPPNAASCGGNGAVIVTRGDSTLVSKNSLTCAQSGTSCATTSVDLALAPGHTTPPGQIDAFASSDIDISRLSSGHVLAARMFRRNPNGPPPDLNNPLSYRGMVAFFDSADCGNSWTEISQIDPHGNALLDFDMGRLFADPWSSRIFYVVQDASGVSAAYISTDGGHTWAAPHLLTWGFVAYRVTTLRSGRAYFFGTNANNALLYQFDPVQGWSSAMTIATNDWDAPAGAMDNHGLTRIGQFPDGDYVRALYPTKHGTAIQQDVTVAVVRVSGTPPVATVMSSKVFSASAATGSVTAATFVETDRYELPAAATENSAMLYWQETNGAPSSSTTITMKGALVRDMASWTGTFALDPNTLPAFDSPFGWANYRRQGDYSRGAFFYDSGTQSLNFLPQWVDGGVSTNIIRFPQSNFPEEQFSFYESLGVASTGGGFSGSPAISSWGPGRLDVFAKAKDGSVRHKAFSSGAWASSWDSVPVLPSGKLIIDSPGAVSSQSGQIDLLVSANDSLAYYSRFLSGSWSSWVSIGRPALFGLISGLAVTTWSGGRLDVFAEASDHNVWHAACGSGCTSGANWSGWENLGGSALRSGPAAVAWASGRIDIFAIGSDFSLSHKSWDNCCGWSGWESQGGDFADLRPPAVASWASGRLDLFAVGNDMLSYHKSWDGSYGWSTWLSTNSYAITTTTGIGAVSQSNPGLDVVIRANDGTIWHKVNAR